jgi:hypothetical protein
MRISRTGISDPISLYPLQKPDPDPFYNCIGEGEIMATTIKFMWNGIKADGKLYRAWYSIGPYTPESGIPTGTMRIIAKRCGHLPEIEGLTIANDTDLQIDHFESDRITIAIGERYYTEALAAYNACLEHDKKRNEKYKQRVLNNHK